MMYVGIYAATTFEARRFSERIPVCILNHSVQLASRAKRIFLASWERLLSANIKAERWCSLESGRFQFVKRSSVYIANSVQALEEYRFCLCKFAENPRSCYTAAPHYAFRVLLAPSRRRFRPPAAAVATKAKLV